MFSRFNFTIIVIAVLEVLSIYAWAFSVVDNIAFVVIALGVLLVSLYDLRYGVAVALAELIIGSHGYLFSLQLGESSLSIRLGIFTAVMIAATVHAVRKREFTIRKSEVFWPLLILGAAIVYATIRGLSTSNGLSNVFFDMNGFMFFALAFPLWQAIKTKKDWKLLLEVGAAALLMSVLKVAFLLYIFSHKVFFAVKVWWFVPNLYIWVRDTRIGEITMVTDAFHRVFFQSQLFSIVGFFILLLFITAIIRRDRIKNVIRDKTWWTWMVFAVLVFSSVLISFSRSNWVGVAAAALCLPFVLWLSTRRPLKRIVTSFGTWIVVALLSVGVITSIVLFPYPPTTGEFSAGSLISQRALSLTGEAGVSSRWQLLDPLWDEVNDHWILGSGFGEEVTYITKDPRILAENPTGEYTTMTFEWGYLDLWLKLGIIGILAYAYFIFAILKRSVKALRLHRQNPDKTWEMIVLEGLVLGGIALLAIHIFSPYLNHPLGIGFLLFWGLFVDHQASQKSGLTTRLRG